MTNSSIAAPSRGVNSTVFCAGSNWAPRGAGGHDAPGGRVDGDEVGRRQLLAVDHEHAAVAGREIDAHLALAEHQRALLRDHAARRPGR